MLYADSIIVDVAGRDPPFLVASGAYATFSNCLFRNMHLPRSELFDVSLGGVVSLLNCHFSNVSAQTGLVDTTFNDYLLFGPHNVYSYGVYSEYTTEEDGVYGVDDHEAYDIALAPASEGAALAYGSDYVVVDETISDCLFPRLAKHVLPGCPEGSVAERNARIAGARPSRGDASSSPAEAPAEVDPMQATFTRQNSQQQEEEDVKRGNAFYDQYYDYNADPDYVNVEMTYLYVSEDVYYVPASGPVAGSPITDDNGVTTLGVQLSTNHLWFQAIDEGGVPRIELASCLFERCASRG